MAHCHQYMLKLVKTLQTAGYVNTLLAWHHGIEMHFLNTSITAGSQPTEQCL